jgi:succinoglycan biosynthesis transport protein ExoP
MHANDPRRRPSTSEPAVAAGLEEAFALAIRHRVRIALALLLPPLAALALILLMPKAYRAQSDILVKTGREYMAQTDGGSSGMTAPSSTKQEGINSEIALLTSRAVMEGTIEAIGLQRLYPDIVATPPTSGSLLDAAVLRFTKDLGVDPVKMSNVIATTFDASAPDEAKRVLDTVIRIYIAKHTEVFAARRTLGYRDSIDTTMTEIHGLEQRRSRIKLEGGIYDIAAQRQALIGQRVEAEGKLQEAVTRQAQLRARVQFLTSARDKIAATVVSVTTEKNDESVHAREALIDLRQQEAALSARLGDSNPELMRVRSQIATVQRAAEGAKTQRSNTTTSVSSMRQQVDQDLVMAGAELAPIQAEIDRLRATITARNGELERLERADLDLRNTNLQIDVLTDNLKSMQGRYEQARADEETEIARQVSVVQVAPAIASEKPVRPKPLLMGVGGVFGGFLLAGLVALMSALLSRTVVTTEAAERRLGLPVLAAIPLRRAAAGPVTFDLT